MERTESASPVLVAVCDLADGDHFRWRDAEWEVEAQPGRFVAWLEGGFGSRVTFCDPVTAAKAGELSWDTQVERAAGETL